MLMLILLGSVLVMEWGDVGFQSPETLAASAG
jgi:hypothetical protein